ncbi:isopentenyl-diphosphate Delta-isomerase [Rosenbergiella epipactidis]|uniref:isopentenyl-diphosphate Delta-isomerase n=1 Tax=Rosenbergiella epipactidis TaxID=1544694 RepID=UPI0006645159|nr:isopentenyl-diphosphate Delta-isomerase [Rosenbergiella epipactidis]KMV73671.1 isopentenyl-diphosphate delta-isomerase [bacteria symbiont BFo2 of Frankliniella occidentalis]KYP92607.1 isopentenyl-diphosphate delta-isomerase [bacteria symbiont BFo2 of Frankliniella occidentalis]KYP96837.1 isopentenyl-diphosphate delta-isomerase [bacteria symbiont BFo2 of Frankliniella occidentalis]
MENIEVILVDEHDNPLGKMEKLAAHRQGRLHRAITVYIFNTKQQLMLQQRAFSKYHCGGLWSNTCCGHPFPNESTQQAAERRLEEEMGLKLPLTKLTQTYYNLPVTDGLVEHEFGHIFTGLTDQLPVLNPHEAENYRFASLSEVQQELITSPERFTPWFKTTFPMLAKQLQAGD